MYDSTRFKFLSLNYELLPYVERYAEEAYGLNKSRRLSKSKYYYRCKCSGGPPTFNQKSYIVHPTTRDNTLALSKS